MKRLLFCATFLLVACAEQPSSTMPTSQSVSITGDVTDPRNRAKTRTELASLYYSRGNMAIALEELRMAVAADPTYPQVHSMFGLVYMQLKENRLAEESFQRALGLAPTDADINHNFGWFLCQTGREKESMQYFLKAVSNTLYTTPWRSYSTAGQCMLRTGNLPEAESYFSQALKLDPNEPLSLLKMGDIRLREGKPEEARNYVKRFHTLVVPNAESLWLAVRIERKLGERLAESSFASQLRRRFPSSNEYQLLQRGAYD